MSTRRTPSQGLLDLLVAENVIASSAAERVRARVRDAWLPIGKILRQRGHLTMGQLMDLLQRQTADRHMRLGALAVHEGFCTEKDLNEVLRVQRETSLHPLEILLAESDCDRERLLEIVLRYVRELESQIAEIPAPKR